MHYSKYVVLGKVSKEVSLDELSRNLQLNSIVSCDDRPLGLVAHWDLVFFARTWAGWALDAAQKKPPEEALVALSLVDQWLQDPGSVSREELNAAAGAASRAARAAAGAAAAAWAADAAAAAGAAGAAEAAAESAVWAADAAAAAWAASRAAEAAARAAAWAAGAAARAAEAAARAAAYQRQGEFITEHLKNSSESLWRLV